MSDAREKHVVDVVDVDGEAVAMCTCGWFSITHWRHTRKREKAMREHVNQDRS